MNKKIIFLKIILSSILLGYLFTKIDIKQFKIIFNALDYRYFILAFILIFINTSLSSLKWKLLLKSDGEDVPFLFLLQSYFVSYFMSVFLPSNIGGDVIRIYDVAHKTKSTSKSIASVFIDRASGFFALSSIGFLASIIGFNVIKDKNILLFLLIIFSVIFISFIALFNKKIHHFVSLVFKKIPIQKISNLFEKFTLSLQTYGSKKALLFKILCISFTFQFLVVVIVYIYSLGLHFETRFLWFMMFIPIIIVIETIPLTPYSLGTRDWGYVFFFTQVGLQIEKAEFLALTFLSMNLLYSLMGGIVFIFRRKKSIKSIS